MMWSGDERLGVFIRPGIAHGRLPVDGHGARPGPRPPAAEGRRPGRVTAVRIERPRGGRPAIAR